MKPTLRNESPGTNRHNPYHPRMNTTTRNESPPARWLSVSEAAARLGVSSPTVRRWVKDGHLRAVQPAGEQGVLRIPEAELERLAEGQERTA